MYICHICYALDSALESKCNTHTSALKKKHLLLFAIRKDDVTQFIQTLALKDII